MIGIKEKTLLELASDADFFEGLKKGEYILILGAGFSYGIQNQSTEFESIPTSKQFVSHTNDKFKKKVETYEAAAAIWERLIRDDSSLLVAFCNLFKVDKSKFNYLLYANLLTPNWYNIFTFNFDNVLEVIKDKSRTIKYPIISYPDKSTGEHESCIYHIHGTIDGFQSIDQIVFTSSSYGKLYNSMHNCFNVLYGNVNDSGKNLIIVGTQFNEQVVFSKFFAGLKRNNIKIFHFDLYNDDVKEKPEFYNNDYTFIKLEDNNGKLGTELFLQFLKDNRNKIIEINLAGALTIDHGFMDKIKNGTQFTKAKFYSAKQDDNCQWFGVLNNFDIGRGLYPKLKLEVLKAFDKYTIDKVAAIVYGTGGCGKSTLLRRLAIELSEESDFVVIWVQDFQLSMFLDNSLNIIQSDIDNKYLVFVEDWYRLVGIDNKFLGEALLKQSQSISNMRLVIGDRDISGKSYLLYLYNRDNIFELMESENQKIIEQILENYPEWKDASDRVLKDRSSYHTSLFLILFAIVGVNENRIDYNEIDLNSLENTVRKIARYDFKQMTKYQSIESALLGFAKALHYWSCVYADHKIFISYDTFLKIADFFNGNSEISTYFHNWDFDDEALSILKRYINLSNFDSNDKQFLNISLVHFNHDILAERVLSKVELDDWQPYSDIIKKKLLNLITNIGDEYSASIVLKTFLEYETQLFNDNKERRAYIDELFYNKKNTVPHYLSYLPKLGLTAIEIYKYIAVLNSVNIYHPVLWRRYVKMCVTGEIRKDSINILSKMEFFNKVPNEIVTIALNTVKDDEVGKAKAVEVLSVSEFYIKIHNDIVTTALNIVKNDDIGKAKAIEILSVSEFYIKIRNDIVTTTLNIVKDDDIGKVKANEVLSVSEFFYKIPPDIVTTALNILKNNDSVKAKVNDILSVSEFYSEISNDIVATAMNIVKDDDIGIVKANEVLAVSEFYLKIRNDIVATALNIVKDSDNGKVKANEILSVPEFYNRIAPGIVTTALSIVKDDEIVETKAYEVLSVPDFYVKLRQDVVSTALNILKDNNFGKSKANEVLAVPNFYNVVPQVVVLSALVVADDIHIKRSSADHYLNNWQMEPWPLVYTSLSCYGSEDKYPDFIIEIVDKIFDDFHSSRNDKLFFRRYINLLKIPFHNIQSWESCSLDNIRNWNSRNRCNITCTLYCYLSKPTIIIGVCKSILENWKSEVIQRIKQTYGKDHYGDHIKLALGHPELRSLAKTTAEKIKKAKQSNSLEIPEYLSDIVDNILNNEEFPEWSKL